VDASKDDGRSADGKGNHADRREAASLPGLVGIRTSRKQGGNNMSKNVITLTFEGLESEGKDIRLSDLLVGLQNFIGAIKKAEELVSGSDTTAIIYRVIDLKHSSPAVLAVEAYPKYSDYKFIEPSHDLFFGVMDNIQSGKTIVDRLDYDLLSRIKNAASPVGKTMTSLKIEREGNVIYLDRAFKEKIDAFMAPEEFYTGSFRGMLEAINIHGGTNVFNLYPNIGPSKIKCHFTSDLMREAITAIGRRVEIRGVLKYKANTKYPHEADVKAMEIFPPDEELPSFYDLLGADPEITGGLSSEEFIEKIRNER
jgi:hypothetical protein